MLCIEVRLVLRLRWYRSFVHVGTWYSVLSPVKLVSVFRTSTLCAAVSTMPVADTPTDSFKVDWRPGQQAWARAYLQYSGEHSYTVVAFKKTIAIIPMVKVFRGNIVQYGEYSIHANIGDVEREIRGCTIH